MSVFRNLLGATLMSAAISTCATAQTELTMNVWFPRQAAFYSQYMQGWADAVQERTNGEVQIAVPAQSMAPPPGQLQLLLDGGADVVMIINGYYGDLFSPLAIAEVPMTAETEEGAQVALWRTYEEHFASALDSEDYIILGTTMTAANALMLNGDAVDAFEDLQGLKLQVDPGAGIEIFGPTGAALVVASGVNTFQNISTGVVDGALMTVDSAVTLQYDRYVQNVIEFPGGMTRYGFSFLMSREAYDALTPEQQQIVRDAAGETRARALGQFFDGFTEHVRGILRGNGATVAMASEDLIAEMAPMVAGARAHWIEQANGRGVDGEAAMQFFLDTAANPN